LAPLKSRNSIVSEDLSEKMRRSRPLLVTAFSGVRTGFSEGRIVNYWNRYLATSSSSNQKPKNDEMDEELRKEVLSVVIGTPRDQLERRVKIFHPPRSATQAGSHSGDLWVLTFPREDKEKFTHWVNPLMGWTSTRDPVTQVQLKFETKEKAIDFAVRNGYEYEVEEEPLVPPANPGKDYADNFRHKRTSTSDFDYE
jgi:hypothetical protein